MTNAMQHKRAPTFWRYLSAQRRRRDPVGDLARDASRDPEFQRRASRFADMSDYLRTCSACDGAHEALRRAWREWSEVTA